MSVHILIITVTNTSSSQVNMSYKAVIFQEYIRKFEKPNTSPNSLEPSTTVLSPYFKFGCVSPRLFFHKLKEVSFSVLKLKLL